MYFMFVIVVWVPTMQVNGISSKARIALKNSALLLYYTAIIL